jgi:metal-responsive CopG/Arc/MetJ family transcriptional regulator
MTQITIDIPDELISRLNSLPTPVSDIIAIALKKYLETETYNITQTETWKLCGTLEISQPDPKYIVGKNEQGEMMTNYAEKIDENLY